MNGVLLDTHVFLFLVDDVERVPLSVRKAIDDAEQRFLSVASMWEMAIKISIGKLRLPEAIERYIPSRTSQALIRPLPILAGHVMRVASLPPLHRDPFDRLLVSQALEEGLTLLTMDRQVAQYDVPSLGVPRTKGRRKRRTR
ncbi:MAG TPA: type II toxin-antitoxin system VapC family toxin [Candidatus Tyrphobacter sp.]